MNKEIFDFLKENLSISLDWDEYKREIKATLVLIDPETNNAVPISSAVEWIEKCKDHT